MDMNDFEIRYLNKGDVISKKRSGLSVEIVDLANKIIESTESYLVKCQYSKVIWENRCFSKSFADEFKKVTSKGIESINKPVGLVLQGVLEVTESFRNDEDKVRERATALIRPGMFFGLFEAYADLYGYWRIKSGITRILITNPLGNKTVRRALGLGDAKDIEETLKFSKHANYDYSSLLNKAKDHTRSIKKEWYTSFLLFDSNNASDELKVKLKSEAISQLSSLVRQNPSESFIDVGVIDPGHIQYRDLKINKDIATFDAILRGHIPLFRLADKNDNTLLPYDELNDVLKFSDPDVKYVLNNATIRRGPNNTMIPHVYVPDTISYNSKDAYLYVHELSGKISSMAVFEQIIRNLNEKKDMLKDITVEQLCMPKETNRHGPNIYCAIVTLPDHNRKGERLVYTIYKTARVPAEKKDKSAQNQGGDNAVTAQDPGGIKNNEGSMIEKAKIKEDKNKLDPGVSLPDWFINEIVHKNGFMTNWPYHLSDLIIIAPGERKCANCKYRDSRSPAHGNPASSKAAHHA